ncbi:MAG: phage tail tube protein, partial [Dichotomicrobium sp.]
DTGRAIKLYWGDDSPQPLVAGVREHGIAFAGEAVDVTDKDDDGWRTLLSKAQTRSVDISISGVADDDTLRADTYEDNRLQAFTLEFHDGAQISGNAYLSGYTETGPHDGEITFEATLMTSGAVTYTPAA